jgi:hypothetical protein
MNFNVSETRTYNMYIYIYLMFIININPWVYSSILMYINESKQEKGMNMIADVIFTNHYL